MGESSWDLMLTTSLHLGSNGATVPGTVGGGGGPLPWKVATK